MVAAGQFDVADVRFSPDSSDVPVNELILEASDGDFTRALEKSLQSLAVYN